MQIENNVEKQSEDGTLHDKFKELLEYGNSNQNWNTLLELKQTQEDILEVSSLWEEVERKGADGSIPDLESAKSEMAAIERKFNDLQEIAKDIKGSSIIGNNFGIQRDLNVRLEMEKLQDENFEQFAETELERLKHFLSKLEEFKIAYDGWITYREKRFEDFINTLEVHNQEEGFQDRPEMYTSFPKDSSKINKQVTGDGGWKGRKH